MKEKIMLKGQWLAGIEYLSLNLFWGIGYLLGFTLVTMLSVGTVFAEEYSIINLGRTEQHRFWVFVREGRFYLVTEVVSAIGWLFLAAAVWIIAVCMAF